jgi:hypothetical protein
MTIVPRLLIREDDGTERLVELPQGVVRIGRSVDNEIVLADADKGVSRSHAELHVEHGRFVIVDLQSQNGTWLNGLRVQRAEVRPDAEIGIGTYRLKLQLGQGASDRSGTGPMITSTATMIGVKPPPRSAEAATTRLDEPIVLRPAAAGLPPPPPSAPSKTPLIIGGLAAVAVIGVVVGRFVIPSTKTGVPVETAATAPASAPASLPAEPTAPRVDPPPAAASEAAATPSTSEAARKAAPAPGSANGTGNGSSRPRGTAAAAAEATRAVAPDLPVTRKPGESLDQWRERSAALQARYAYSKVALDRGDYAAAAGGFAAILLDEPGFLDAPQLLVKARDGLRSAALAAMESGKRLDATGDYVAAIRKFEQAREIDKAVPGLEDAFKRVREKMRAAGAEAMRRAKLYDGAGRAADALKEYEKAAQWLPGDDPDRETARSRAEQLKTKLR